MAAAGMATMTSPASTRQRRGKHQLHQQLLTAECLDHHSIRHVDRQLKDSQQVDNVYYPMDGFRRGLASTNEQFTRQSIRRGADIVDVNSTPRMVKSLSDDTLSTHSRRRRKDRHRKRTKSPAKDERFTDKNGDLLLIVSPIAAFEDDERVELLDSTRMCSDPDLLEAVRMRPFWDLRTPVDVSPVRSNGPFHSSPQELRTPLSGGNKSAGIGNSSTLLDTIQSENSPGCQIPAAPAASPVSDDVATVSLPPPQALNVSSAARNGRLQSASSSVQCHVTAECGSNPDSGYDGSKIYSGCGVNRLLMNPSSTDYVNLADVASNSKPVSVESVVDVVGWHQDSSPDRAVESTNNNCMCYMQNSTVDRLIFSPVRGSVNCTKLSRDEDCDVGQRSETHTPKKLSGSNNHHNTTGVSTPDSPDAEAFLRSRDRESIVINRSPARTSSRKLTSPCLAMRSPASTYADASVQCKISSDDALNSGPTAECLEPCVDTSSSQQLQTENEKPLDCHNKVSVTVSNTDAVKCECPIVTSSTDRSATRSVPSVGRSTLV